MKCYTFLISSIRVYLYYVYISNFFYIMTSTAFVFQFFQRSLFPYLIFTNYIKVAYYTLSFILNCNILA